VTIKKAIQSIEENNKYHLMMIYLYDRILKRYEELDRTYPPHSEFTETMRQIFTNMITMIKRSREAQVQFNKHIIKMLTKNN
jgi:hypothetical protein